MQNVYVQNCDAYEEPPLPVINWSEVFTEAKHAEQIVQNQDGEEPPLPVINWDEELKR